MTAPMPAVPATGNPENAAGVRRRHGAPVLDRVRGWWRAWRQPIAEERHRVNASRRATLAPELRVTEQILGVAHHACGATHGVMERCNFACTSCYLATAANATPPLDAPSVHRQLDELRAFLGPQGKAQITSGEVTLLPRDVLGGYIDYARSIGLDPMVMTHGQTFLDDPSYLRDLVAEHGLEKVSIHVDVTQRGRRGWRSGLREADMHPVRDRYAALIRTVRRATGATLHAAHTVTVTEQNFDDVADVVRWMTDRLDAFRMVSFQPVASVGRTQDHRIDDLGLDDVWRRICDGLGQPLNRHAMLFGHPECHIVAPVVVVRCGRRQTVLETAREGKGWDRVYLRRLLRAIGGFTVRGKRWGENAIGFVSLCLRHPGLLVETPLYALYRLWGLRRFLARAAFELVRLRPLSIRPLAIVVHKFMSPDELDTDIGRARLAACTFQVPVEGRMTPMCAVNATGLRAELNASIRANVARVPEADPGRRVS